MKNLFFYDAGCRVGRNMLHTGKSVEDLIAHMDYSGVDKALIVHAGVINDVVHSNQQVTQMVAQVPDRFTGTWCFLPEQCPEVPGPDKIFDEMGKNNIRALIFFPDFHRYIASRVSIGRMMDAAAERNVPIFLDNYTGKSQVSWEQLYAFLEKFPQNTFIFRAEFGKWGNDRFVRPLLENYPNFYFGLGGYWVPEGIYELAARYGAERLLFSSNYPIYNMGCQMLQLKHSRLSDEQIALIAGKNLERLLKGAQL